MLAFRTNMLAQIPSGETLARLADAGALTVMAIVLLTMVLAIILMSYAIYRGLTGFVEVQRENNRQTVMLKDAMKEIGDGMTRVLRQALEQMGETQRALDDTQLSLSGLSTDLRAKVPQTVSELVQEVENLHEVVKVLQTHSEVDAKTRDQLEELVTRINRCIQIDKENQLATSNVYPDATGLSGSNPDAVGWTSDPAGLGAGEPT